ncbi:MAG: class I SAM-dependent methyltransferase, partial [Armatimonadetes bacterium]|nr:class I SAM-dependent methyltransferase [Armatimonadota bacterium]
MATRPRLREALDNKGRWLRFWHRTRQRLKNIRIGTGPGGRQPWGQSTLSGIEQRRYGTYEEYVEQQRAKLLTLRPDWLAGYDTRYHQALRARLGEHGLVGPGSSVLCLAARIGTEVKAFLDLGCFAVGIDLNPGAENRYVVTGDFHALQFPDQCVDAVFTNSLDHAFDLPRLLGEIRRVLRPEGLVVLE